jgi:hypothetical protein
MGYMHFTQMYEDALDLDCWALAEALQLYAGSRLAASRPGALAYDPWSGCSFDDIMRDARKLVVLYQDNYVMELKELVARGAIQPRMPAFIAYSTDGAQPLAAAIAGTIAQPMQVVQDPDVIDCDDPQLTVVEFYRLLLAN